MATVTVTPGYNWVSGEVVTPAKMNLAAAPTATVSAIVAADIAGRAPHCGSKLSTAAGRQAIAPGRCRDGICQSNGARWLADRQW
jgi:hypothetical protein